MSDAVAVIVICAFGVILLIIKLNAYISEQFQAVAEDKGYTGRQYFWLCFFLGITGYILVTALKDKQITKNVETEQAKANAEGSTNDTVQSNVGSEIEKGDEANAESTPVNNQRYICPKCGADVKYGDAKCNACMQLFIWEQ